MNNDGKRTVNIGVIAVIGLIVVFVALLAAFIILASGLNVPKGEQLEKPSDVEKKVGTTVEQDNGKKVEETSVINETTEKTEPDDPVTMYIANVENSVYFRSEPKEADSNIMTTIPVGTAVSFLQNEGATFAKIKYNGQTGYVKSDVLK